MLWLVTAGVCFWLLCSLFRTFTAYLPRLFIIRCFSADVTVFCFSHLVVYPLYWNRLVDVCYTLVNLVRMCCLSFGGLVFALYAFYMCFLPAGVISLCDCFFQVLLCFWISISCLCVVHVFFTIFCLLVCLFFCCFACCFFFVFGCSVVSCLQSAVFVNLCCLLAIFKSSSLLLSFAPFGFVCFSLAFVFWTVFYLVFLYVIWLFVYCCFFVCVLFAFAFWCVVFVFLPFDFWLLFFFSFFALWICIACFCLFICFLVSWICFFFACAASFVFLLLFFLVAFACSFASFLLCCVYLFCLLVGFAFLVAFCFFICFLWFFVFALLRLLFVVAFSYLVKPSEIA